jgi:putative ABC transport system permease protein
MIRLFFKTIIRTLSRNKGFSAINIAGLAIGMAAALLILLWVQNEISFDRFYSKTDRVSLLYSGDMDNGKLDVWPNVTALMAPELKKNYPEVEDAVRFRSVYFLLTVNDKHLNLEGGFADSTFFSVLDFPLLNGTVANSLNGEHSIAITQSLAKKLFGNEDAMGKTVRVDSADNFTVTAVLKDLPANTNFSYQYLLPWSYLTKLGWEKGQTWAYANTSTYVLLKNGVSATAFDQKIKNIVKNHVREGDGSNREIISQPLSHVHLYSKAENGKFIGGRIDTVKMFVTIAVFILLIACINFMNLSTARSERRAKEAGIRKVVGARRYALVLRFMGESTVFALIAFMIALVMVQACIGPFSDLVGVPLLIHFNNPLWWIFALAFVLLTGLVAGSYPAFFLSSFKPAQVLKGTFRNVGGGFNPRKILVVLQFTFATVLIISTVIVQQQLQFARNRDTGYNKSNLVYTFSQGDVLKNYRLIKNDLLNSGAVVGVTKLYSPITRSWGNTRGLSWPGSTADDKKINFIQFEADADFVKTAGTTLLKGRDINLDANPSDSSAMLLNESAVKAMRLQNPLGALVKNERGVTCRVVGMLKDFIIQSPYEAVKPMVIQGLSTTYPVVHFRLNPANPTAVNLAKAEKIFKQYNPQYPFDYVFADEAFAEKFRNEKQDGTLAALFAGLTIFISCLGLFGLATYMAESRTKEIGIRKVLGASISGITRMLSIDFIKLVLLAVLIASPIAWLLMNGWLQGFTYHTKMEWWVFACTGLGAVLITLFTVSFQSIKAALTNPVKSLKAE